MYFSSTSVSLSFKVVFDVVKVTTLLFDSSSCLDKSWIVNKLLSLAVFNFFIVSFNDVIVLFDVSNSVCSLVTSLFNDVFLAVRSSTFVSKLSTVSFNVDIVSLSSA